MPNKYHSRANNILTLIVVVFALYIFVAPFLPLVSYRIKKATVTNSGYPYKSEENPQSSSRPIPSDNRLVVPSILLDEAIKEGPTIKVISLGGLWRRPLTSDPSRASNTVIIGHRYDYSGGSTLYNLDKVKVGDPILIYWQGKEFVYRVTTTKVVNPSDTSVEQQTNQATLTMYTCTPLWNAKNRLVVIAHLEKGVVK